MKTQTTIQNTDSIRFLRKKNSNAWRSLALAVLVLLATVSYAGAQSCRYLPNICSNDNGQLCGENLCPSRQYRSGSTGAVYPSLYNADLTGAPFGGGAAGVLDLSHIWTYGLHFKFTPVTAPGRAGCGSTGSTFGGGLNPTSSPSSAQFIIFPAKDGLGNCDLYEYTQEGLPAHPPVVLGPDSVPVTSSSLQFTVIDHQAEPVAIASENGNLYGYHPASLLPWWTFTAYQQPGNTAPNPFDASPILALDSLGFVDAIYAVDIYGVLYKVDAYNGIYSSAWPAFGSVNSDILLPGGAPSDGVGKYTPSASSVSVSTCGTAKDPGKYYPCTMLFVAGYATHVPTGDVVCAYDSGNASNYWCKTFGPPVNAIISSPVVSDSQGLVYVQDNNFAVGGESTLYALDQNNGSPVWSVSLGPSPPPFTFYYSLPYGGSPAYDDGANHGTSKYVITVGSFRCSFSHGAITTSCGQFSDIQVFDATRNGNGNLVCSADASHIISQSSPEVVNGVIYVGTDDGYVLAFDETQCHAGNLPLIWTSDPMDSPLASPPVVSFNRIQAVSQSGTLYVWGLPGY